MKPITEKELNEIRESVERAIGRIYLEPKVGRDWRRMVAEEAKLPPDVPLQKRMLFSLMCSESPDVRLEPIPSVITKAVQDNDLSFFVELGHVLETREATLKDYKKPWLDRPEPSRLVEFLLNYWAEPRDGLPELFRLTREGLAEVCNYRLKSNYSDDAVQKWRQRLGLKVFTPTPRLTTAALLPASKGVYAFAWINNPFLTTCELKGALYQNSIQLAAECCVPGQPCPPFSRGPASLLFARDDEVKDERQDNQHNRGASQ